MVLSLLLLVAVLQEVLRYSTGIKYAGVYKNPYSG